MKSECKEGIRKEKTRRAELRRRLRRKYRKLIEKHVDPEVAKVRLLNIRIPLKAVISKRRLANILSETD